MQIRSLYLFLFIFGIKTQAQTIVNGTGETLSPENFSYINSDKDFNPVGIYHFGDSEWESYLCIFKLKERYIAQYRYSEIDTTKKNPFIPVFVNLKNVIIKNGYFYSKEWQGRFVHYQQKINNNTNEADGSTGIIINKTAFPDLIERNEYGTKEQGFYILEGKYTEASYRLLSEKELMLYNKKELRIMRNEIFARYSYRFKKGGDMERYFSNTDWYKAIYTDVNDFLTEIEKYNIHLILKHEQ